jgi:hypothetical protein
MQWLRDRPFPLRVILYVLALAAAFLVSAGIGATGVLVVQGGFGLLGGEPRPSNEGAAVDPLRQETTGPPSQSENTDASTQRENTTPSAQQKTTVVRQTESEYVREVGEIQDEAVGAFRKVDGKLRRYDTLSTDDLGKMEASLAVLERATRRVEDLEPPQQREQQYEVFRAAIKDLYEAGALSYRMVDNPLSVTPANEDAYDDLVKNALANLRWSNERLDRDYEVVEEVRRNVL